MALRLDTTRPYDLLAVGIWSLATAVAVTVIDGGTLRVILGLPFVLFLPGYALVSALFPERHRTVVLERGEEREEREEVREGLDALERIALAFGLSIAVVPLIGLALNYTPWGIRAGPIVAGILAFTLASAGVAAWRRARLPDAERLRIAFEISAPSWRSYSAVDKALVLALVVAVVVAGGALAYALGKPRTGERFTEFYVLGPGGKAADYPSNLTIGENAIVILGVANREKQDFTYTVRLIDEVGAIENGTFRSRANNTLRSWSVTVGDGDVHRENLTLAFTDAAVHKVRFELDKPGSESPYRRLHLWVNVRS